MVHHKDELHNAFMSDGYLKEEGRIFMIVVKLLLIFVGMSLGLPLVYWFYVHKS